jgi:glycosyltransferase involved in cell wall biosynthesis
MGQGGADRVTLTLLQHLDRGHFEIALVLMRQEGEFLSDIPDDVIILALNSPTMWTAWPAATQLLRRHRPDIVFSTSSGMNVLVSLAHWLAGQRCRLVLSERNILKTGGSSIKRRLLTFLKCRLYRRADMITAVSDCVKQDLVAGLKLPRHDIFVVYNPSLEPSLAEKARESLNHAWLSNAQVPVILSAGRLVAQKDFATLLQAFQIVRQQREARLIILGEGPLRDELQALAESLGVAADFQLPGFDKNPFRYMARATLFVQSSRNEGLPNALIQAMACGAAVISTDCRCGPNEIIARPGQDGLLVPVGDAPSLAEKMTFLLDHPNERRKMAEAGRISVQRFAVGSVVERYEAALTGELARFQGEQAQ